MPVSRGALPSRAGVNLLLLIPSSTLWPTLLGFPGLFSRSRILAISGTACIGSNTNSKRMHTRDGSSLEDVPREESHSMRERDTRCNSVLLSFYDKEATSELSGPSPVLNSQQKTRGRKFLLCGSKPCDLHLSAQRLQGKAGMAGKNL